MDGNEKKDIVALEDLLGILRRLLGPGGCPWDRKQSLKTMAPHIVEEAFEVSDAIDGDNAQAISEELGDLSMNMLMSCLIAEKEDKFTLEEVFKKISGKLINRHPHVFGDEGPMEEERFLQLWEDIKKSERKKKKEDTSAVAGIPKALPALLKATRLAEKIDRTGADLPFLHSSAQKIKDLIDDVFAQDKGSGNKEELEYKTGELIFNIVILLMNKKLNPEMALRSYLHSLEERFRGLENKVEGEIGKVPKTKLDELWAD